LIQTQAIPIALQGRDILARARTGRQWENCGILHTYRAEDFASQISKISILRVSIDLEQFFSI